MTAKERKRLKDLEHKVGQLEAHQHHLSPYQCPYCTPFHFVPWHVPLWPHVTNTWIGTVGPSETFDLTVGNQTVVSGEQTVTSGYIASTC